MIWDVTDRWTIYTFLQILCRDIFVVFKLSAFRDSISFHRIQIESLFHRVENLRFTEYRGFFFNDYRFFTSFMEIASSFHRLYITCHRR